MLSTLDDTFVDTSNPAEAQEVMNYLVKQEEYCSDLQCTEFVRWNGGKLTLKRADGCAHGTDNYDFVVHFDKYSILSVCLLCSATG